MIKPHLRASTEKKSLGPRVKDFMKEVGFELDLEGCRNFDGPKGKEGHFRFLKQLQTGMSTVG